MTPSITCPACGKVSYNPNDIEQRYCGNCHLFHDQMLCVYCKELVAAGEQDEHNSCQPIHHACGFRLAAGSVAHLEGRCSCFVRGSEEGDPPGMTKRQAAEAALAAAAKVYKDSVKVMLDTRDLGEP